MKEQHFGYRIKRTLNQGLSLDPAVLDRLKAARETALGRQRAEEPSLLFAWATQVAGPGRSPRSLVSTLLLSAVLLVAGLLLVDYWNQAQTAQEIVEIDSAVLMGELPLDAYLDTGFDAWLKRSSDSAE
jgi:hypothetical protein